MRGILRTLALIALAITVVTTSYAAGFTTSLGLLSLPQPVIEREEETLSQVDQQFKVFWEAWHIIEQEFYRQTPDPQEMTYASIRGMVEAFNDPGTVFVDPMHTALLSSDLEGSFEGIGAIVEMRDGKLFIVQPLAGKPAEKAGLRPGDMVIKVGDTVIEDMSILEAISLIRGPKGTPVRLTIVREGVAAPFVVEIVRDVIDLPILEARMLEQEIAYIKLNNFGARSASEFEEALSDMLAQEPKGLILDLRDNPGGYLHIAVEVGSQFIDRGLILSERGKDEAEREHPTSGGGLATEVPLVVLVNGGTASASEIVAGAIQDHGRGMLIGEPTFGKGSVQNIHNLSDGSSLRVTMARWFTPNGRQIQDQGLVPDIEVERTGEDIESNRDPPLERAIEYLGGKQ